LVVRVSVSRLLLMCVDMCRQSNLLLCQIGNTLHGANIKDPA